MNPETLFQNVQVRRHNGQNGFGKWLEAADAGVPEWVLDVIGDEIAENAADSGSVERGGSKWEWRKS
jgi:hypothetical protein